MHSAILFTILALCLCCSSAAVQANGTERLLIDCKNANNSCKRTLTRKNDPYNKYPLNCDVNSKEGRLEIVLTECSPLIRLTTVYLSFNVWLTFNHVLDVLNEKRLEILILADLNEIHLDRENVLVNRTKQLNLIKIYQSNFSIYKGGKLISNSESDCNAQTFNNNSSNKDSIFKGFTKFILQENNYPHPICPLMFRNVNFDEFILKLDNNRQFIVMNVSDGASVNARIKKLHLSEVKEIGKNLLNKNLFGSIENIFISSTQPFTIDDDVFDGFEYLKSIYVSSFNFSDFYIQYRSFFRGLKRNSSLLQTFNNEKYDHDAKYLEITTELELDQFKEKDFCQFIDFPHEKLIVPSIAYRQIDCGNCLQLFLFMNRIFSFGFNHTCESIGAVLKRATNCHFDKRIKECDENYEPKMNYTNYLLKMNVYSYKYNSEGSHSIEAHGVAEAITELDKYLKTSFAKEIRISLRNNILNESINLTTYVARSNEEQFRGLLDNNFHIQFVSGFSTRAFPLFDFYQASSNTEISVRLYFFNFRAYDLSLSRLVNISSSRDLLISHFNLRKNFDVEKNLSDSLYTLRSLFGMRATFLNISANCRFFEPLSPILFFGANLLKLTFWNFVDTLVQRNYLRFTSDDTNIIGENYNNDLKISELYILEAFNFNLNADLLTSVVFNSLDSFYLTGSLRRAEENLFKSFDYLRTVWLTLSNRKQFLHSSSDHKWLLSLNAKVFHDLTEIYDEEKFRDSSLSDKLRYKSLDFSISSLSQDNYTYPDEDFCLFRHFPHNHLVFYYPKFEDYEGDYTYEYTFKTNLFFHLTRNLYLFNFIETRSNKYIVINNTSLLDKMLRNCFINETSIHVEKAHFFYYEDLFDTIKIFQFIVPIILMPIVSFIGLATNSIAFVVIFHKKSKEIYTENERIFQYFAFNSLFSMLDCILSSLTIMSECMGLNSFYCSPFLFYAQYLRIYGIAYFSEVMKSCSLLIMLTFSLERYTVASNSENFILKRLTKIKVKFFAIFYLLFALLFCTNKIFELSTDNFNLNKYSTELPRLVIHLNINDPNLSWFAPFHWIHYVSLNLLIGIATIVVDFLLVGKMKFFLDTKEKFYMKMLNESTGENKEIVKQLVEIKKTRKKSKKLIRLQIATFLLFKLPELLIYAYLASPWFIEIEMASLGLQLVNLAKFIYLFSYLTNLLFYYKFNGAFKQAFKNSIKLKNSIKKSL